MSDDDDENNKLDGSIAEKPAKRMPPAAGMGRIKGSQNKFTKVVKNALLESLDTLGGPEYFVWLGRNHPAAYAQLVGKIIPQEIKAEIDHTVTGVVFKTVYETAPETLSYAPPATIDAIILEEPEPIEIKPGPASSSPE